jgi:hypothetical protein
MRCHRKFTLSDVTAAIEEKVSECQAGDTQVLKIVSIWDMNFVEISERTVEEISLKFSEEDITDILRSPLPERVLKQKISVLINTF